jgi:alkyldihydroxyacetonephosphate synthase
VDVYSQVEHQAREEILRRGGTISHHHGIGKIRAGFFKDTVSQQGIDILKAIKQEIDPKNIFAAGNLSYGEQKEHKDDSQH